jgi:lipoprotein-anchoring transpeptidase ErfK/SrfK
VHYRPKEYWQAGTTLKVTAKIYGTDFGNGVFGAADRTEIYKVHDSWIAKAVGSNDQMQILHNGQMVKSMPISLGKDATPTHLGPHVISFTDPNYTMDSCTYGVCQGQQGYYRSVEKWSTRISNDGEFVHENPNSVGPQGSSNVSHGCINLNSANAQWFFQNLGLGDVVEVTNSGGPQCLCGTSTATGHRTGPSGKRAAPSSSGHHAGAGQIVVLTGSGTSTDSSQISAVPTGSRTPPPSGCPTSQQQRSVNRPGGH